MSEYKSCIRSLKRLEDGGMKIRMEIPSVDHQVPSPLVVNVIIGPEWAQNIGRCSLESVEISLLHKLNTSALCRIEDLKRGNISR